MIELRYFVYKSGLRELQYRNEDRWVDGSTTANGKWVFGEWKEVPWVYDE